MSANALRQPVGDLPSWRVYPGRRVSVHAPEGSYAATAAPTLLREAERIVAALDELLKPAAARRAAPFALYLVGPATALPAGLATIAGGASAPPRGGSDWRLATTADGEHVLLAVIRPASIGSPTPSGDLASVTAPGASLVRPLILLAITRLFGAPAASATLVIDGLAGVVAARIGRGPAIDAINDQVRAALANGCLPALGAISQPPAPAAPAAPATPVDAVAPDAPGASENTPDTFAATSFVSYLIESAGAPALRQFLAAYDPTRRDQALLAAYHQPLGALEEAWLASLQRTPGRGAIRRFLFRDLLPLLKPYWRRELEVLAYMLFELVYGLALPLASKYVIDTVIPRRLMGQLAAVILALLALYLLDALVGMRRVYVNAWINGRILIGLQEKMFAHLQRLPHGFYAAARIGDLMSRLSNDIEVVHEAMMQVAGVGLFLALRALATTVVIVALSPLLGALILVVVPLFAVSYLLLRSRLERASYEYQALTGQVAAVAQENLSAHALIKAFGRETQAVASYRARLLALLKVTLRLTVIAALFEVSMSLAITLGELIVLGVGGWLVIKGHLTVGTLLAYIGLLGALFQPIGLLSNLGQTMQRASGALDRVMELLDAPVTIADKPGAAALAPLTREIRLEGVTFGYGDDQPILHDLDLTIPAGTHLAVVGPTGVGKSTIASLLLRFWDPQQGRVVVDGTDLQDALLASWRGQVGLVFQDTFVFDTTIRENIAIGWPGATDAQVALAARAARLDGYIGSLPAGYDTMLGEEGVRMSGGQRQRLGIARALLRDPRVLILDEATSALDASTEREIVETLAALAGSRTTISITHRLSWAARADHIIVLDGGRVAEQGAHAQLLRAGGLYQRLYEEQMSHLQAAPDPAGQGDATTRKRPWVVYSRLDCGL